MNWKPTDTQTLRCRAWNPEGELALHLVFTFVGYRDRWPEVEEIVGAEGDIPFFLGVDARSIATQWVPGAEAIGWTAEIKVEGGPLPSKYGDGDLEQA